MDVCDDLNESDKGKRKWQTVGGFQMNEEGLWETEIGMWTTISGNMEETIAQEKQS